jgi:hypothetical protein
VGGEYVGERGSMVTGWWRIGGRGEDGERVDEKGQKEQLGGRTMDCSTGKGGKVKGVRLGIRKY